MTDVMWIIGEIVLKFIALIVVGAVMYTLLDWSIRLYKMHRRKVRSERMSVQPKREYDPWE